MLKKKNMLNDKKVNKKYTAIDQREWATLPTISWALPQTSQGDKVSVQIKMILFMPQQPVA